MARKVIITCAVTGAIHTPSMSKALPVTPQEIADAAVDAAEAGAAIVHLHARNPRTGQPDQSPEAFAPFLKIIKQRSNCVINLTTGGAPTMTVDERVRPAAVYKPEVASLNMGSMNFAFFGMLNRFKKFEHDWELKHLQNKDIVFRNTFADIEYVLKTLSETGTRFGGVDRGVGDFLRRHRQRLRHRGGVDRAGHGAGDDDFAAHGMLTF